MIDITTRATQAIQQAREDAHIPVDQGVRITPDGSGSMRMTFDEPGTTDVVLRDGESPTLILDSNVAGHLANMVLDYQEAADRGAPSFVLRRRSDEDGAGATA